MLVRKKKEDGGDHGGAGGAVVKQILHNEGMKYLCARIL